MEEKKQIVTVVLPSETNFYVHQNLRSMKKKTFFFVCGFLLTGRKVNNRRKGDKSQLPYTGSVVGSARFVDGFAEELVVQLVGGLDLQFDGEILEQIKPKHHHNEKKNKQKVIFKKSINEYSNQPTIKTFNTIIISLTRALSLLRRARFIVLTLGPSQVTKRNLVLLLISSPLYTTLTNKTIILNLD